ncbi:Peptidyl-prolyl cis-trans isomerase NIMA-interacting 1-like [Oopsacas minuta]|uniref:Peptidyl-prolyl cis-trans isomerase n=1 Tax=Oopsacas minuta TaxID=111878 RepID=A0AAV7K7C6_9METZ|nr:Peptidyl-prolyl cis-trans isomerase NIMA-interacting 1-like [Oopsacas minuta]
MASNEDLPPGWVVKTSRSNDKPYYYNTNTKESRWERPKPDNVRASHILAKHNKSRRPSSWKQATITRSKAEALKMIKEFRERIVNGEDFAMIAKLESDCGSAKNGGDLGEFGRGAMQKPFEDATYALEVGELSQPVDTDSGIHIILRTK